MENKIQNSRSWLVAALVAIITFAGALATKWIATDLEPKIHNYRWIAYVIAGIFLIVSIVLRVQTASGSVSAATSNRHISIGGSANNSTNTAGDNNTINSSRNP